MNLTKKHEQQADNKTGKRRGPYRTATSGQIPLQKAERSVKKLAEKSFKRGQELELCKKQLKRRDEKIAEFEYLLKSSNNRVIELDDENDDLGQEITQLTEENKELKSALEDSRSQLEFYAFQMEQLQKQLATNANESTKPLPETERFVKKKLRLFG